MSRIEKLSGRLALGPVEAGKSGEFYDFMRVGGTHLKRVKVIAELATLLRDGQHCTVWVARVKVPSPFFFSTETIVLYAIEVDGTVYKAVDEAGRNWNTSRAWNAFLLGVVGLATLPLAGIGLLLWINAVRLAGSTLPFEEMRREPA
ncbi:MAG: hypothetical protein BroJett001_31810 [Chloroflexota bacterium]|nr:MAG: hypothetical protein BroJett001_31810 [Chloroflexota bacterium]